MALSLGKHPGIVVVGLLVAGLLVWGFWPQPVLVEAVQAARGPMVVTVEEEGRTQVLDRYIISSPVDGVACRVQLEVGDRVTAGQALLGISPLASSVLDPRRRAEAEAAVSAADAALAASQDEASGARAQADFFAAELGRLKPLAAQGVISRDELDRARMNDISARAALRSALHGVDVARHALQAARSVLEISAASERGEPAERVVVRSPIDGVVLKLDRECEGPVRTGDPLLEVGDPSQLEVVVALLSADAVQVQPGMMVRFDRWGGEGHLEGVVRTVEPVGVTKVSALGVEEQRVKVVADFTSPAERWQRLGDGYRVEASFVLWQGDDVLQVPAGSLFRHDGGWAVFVMTDGRAALRPLRLGQRNGASAQVLGGLDAGELVINHPNDEVADGRRVKRL